MDAALRSSEKDAWGTPQNVRDVVLSFGGGQVIDPCPGDTPVGAPLGHDNGLAGTWYIKPMSEHERSPILVYCNPPYGRAVKHWVQKCISEANNGVEVVLLVAARTDTHWCHNLFHCADAVCFVRGRLTFLGAPNPAPFPSIVAYFGDRVEEFTKKFSVLGYI